MEGIRKVVPYAFSFSCSDKAYKELHNDILAVAIMVVDILNGASYLFDKEVPLDVKDFKDKNVAELHEKLVVQKYKRNEQTSVFCQWIFSRNFLVLFL